MPLVIVESPNKCPKIKKILGQDYVVKASFGHIYELDKKDQGVDIENWVPIYIKSDSKKDVIKELQEEAKKHDTIYIASDPDREGENIAYSIYDILPKKNKEIHRITFGEITKSALENAIKNPRGFDEKLNKAQQTRRILDRLIGFKFSPVLWSKGLRGTSAGRVQSVVLNWIVSLEKEIKAFKTEEYWSIEANLNDFSAEFYGLDNKITPKNEKEANEILAELSKILIVKDYNAKSRSKSPYPPYTTATLQKDLTSKFGWQAKKVMDVAQNLFSKGLITYLRTDSTRIEPDKLAKLRSEIDSKYGSKYLPNAPRIYKNSDSAQDAHEAILYTGEAIPAGLSADESKMLEAINIRALASQMTDAQYDSTTIVLENAGEKKYTFRTVGSIQTFDGFTKIYNINSKELLLPVVTVGQKIPVKKYIPEQHFTKPPGRFTETSIVAEMEKTEVGRPATYVSAIETLFKHGYIVRDSKSLKPTEIGIMVSDYLENYYKDIVDTDFTAKMEKKLDQIAVGKIIVKDIMEPFYQDLQDKIAVAKKENPKEIFKIDVNCPDCKTAKMVRKSNMGKVFLSCENYPTCGHTMNYTDKGELVSSKVETGLACPECGGMIVEKTGKYGKFHCCENYSTCSWKGKVVDGKIVEKKIQELTEHLCPLCNSQLAKRTAAGKVFLGCSKYPKCNGTMNLDENGNPIAKVKKAQSKATNESCKKCKKGKLLIRESNGSQFKGCDQFPKCRYTEKM